MWLAAFHVFQAGFVRLHSKSTDPVSNYMFTKPVLLHLLFNSSETQFTLPVLIGIREKQSEESRIKGCCIYNRLYCRRQHVCVWVQCAVKSSPFMLCTRGVHPGPIRDHRPALFVFLEATGQSPDFSPGPVRDVDLHLAFRLSILLKIII